MELHEAIGSLDSGYAHPDAVDSGSSGAGEEVGLDCLEQRIPIQHNGLAFEACGPDDLIDEVTGMAGAQFLDEFLANHGDQTVDSVVIYGKAVLEGDAAEDLQELLRGDLADPDLGLDTA